MNYGLVDDVIDTAREDWMAEKGKQDVMREANEGVLPEGVVALPPLKVYTVLCWNHLRNVWFKGIDQEFSKYRRVQFKEELKITDEGMIEAGLVKYYIERKEDAYGNPKDTDRVDASMKKLARATEKLLCAKGLYDKGDQMYFSLMMIEEYPGALLMHLERACSGARHNICCGAALAILVNRT